MSEIIYPTLDLFLYDLETGFGQTAEKIQENRLEFWQRIYHDLPKISTQSLEEKIINLKRYENSEKNFVELLGNQQRVEKFETGQDGYYYPVQLRDTYALHVDYSGKKTAGPNSPLNHNLQSIEVLSQYKKEILSRINHQQGKLGHTWLLWGQVTAVDNNEQRIKEIAKECYKQIIPTSNWERDFQGKNSKTELLGGRVYELWQPPEDWSDLSQLKSSEHLIIWLFPADLKLDDVHHTVLKYYIDFIYLFCYRHKTLWAYSQSQKLKVNLKQQSGQKEKSDILAISTQSNSELLLQKSFTSPSLKELRSTLNQTGINLSNYATSLGQLEAQERTIDININNYKKRLTRFDKDGQLTSLAEFGEFATAKYLQQVQMDRASLSYGLTVLENKIRTIDIIVKTYQTESDRNLNTTVATFGAALGTSQLVAAVMLDQYDTPPNTPFFLAKPFGVSLLAGVVAGAIAWAIFRRH